MNPSRRRRRASAEPRRSRSLTVNLTRSPAISARNATWRSLARRGRHERSLRGAWTVLPVRTRAARLRVCRPRRQAATKPGFARAGGVAVRQRQELLLDVEVDPEQDQRPQEDRENRRENAAPALDMPEVVMG